MAARRHVLAGLVGATVLGAASLSGCGFELKRPPELRFRTIQLTGFAPRSAVAAALRASIASSPTTVVVESAGQAQVVFDSLGDVREKSVVATTAAGQVREYTLRSRLKFRLRTPSGRELIPETEIVLSRDLTYTETAALAKEQEEALLYRAMETDIVSQVMRRLASVQTL